MTNDFPLLQNLLKNNNENLNIFLMELGLYKEYFKNTSYVTMKLFGSKGTPWADYIQDNEIQKFLSENRNVLNYEINIILEIIKDIPYKVTINLLKQMFKPNLKKKLQALNKLYKD
jgi:hypothetical protein